MTGQSLDLESLLSALGGESPGGPDLVYDPPYDTYISNWVGFDPDKANGFHSFLKDKSGAVVDASTGRVSNGCIRTGAEADVYAFAEIGMPVWVHL